MACPRRSPGCSRKKRDSASPVSRVSPASPKSASASPKSSPRTPRSPASPPTSPRSPLVFASGAATSSPGSKGRRSPGGSSGSPKRPGNTSPSTPPGGYPRSHAPNLGSLGKFSYHAPGINPRRSSDEGKSKVKKKNNVLPTPRPSLVPKYTMTLYDIAEKGLTMLFKYSRRPQHFTVIGSRSSLRDDDDSTSGRALSLDVRAHTEKNASNLDLADVYDVDPVLRNAVPGRHAFRPKDSERKKLMRAASFERSRIDFE